MVVQLGRAACGVLLEDEKHSNFNQRNMYASIQYVDFVVVEESKNQGKKNFIF